VETIREEKRRAGRTRKGYVKINDHREITTWSKHSK